MEAGTLGDPLSNLAVGTTARLDPLEARNLRHRRHRRRKPATAHPAAEKETEPTESYVSKKNFGSLSLSTPIAKALELMGYATPTPIQNEVIPLMREGRDIVGQAQTGTGKTAAFGIPIVESLEPVSQFPQALVLVPTRELAVQVNKELSKLGQFCKIRNVTIYGGQAISLQVTALQKGVHIIVATPGRLIDHIGRGTVRLEKVRMVVLDEADQMLDIGFAEDIERILRRTPRSRQTALFSATMPRSIKSLVYRYLGRPEWVQVGGDAEPVSQVEQVYYEIAERDREAALDKLLSAPKLVTQALVFRRTKIGVDRLMALLRRRGFNAQAIHGDMTQSQREGVMTRFRSGRLRVLIATNVAARGLDIPAVSHVINFDMPDNLEEYIHRIGRTARMGRAGTAITFVSEWDFPMLDALQAHVGKELKQEWLTAYQT